MTDTLNWGIVSTGNIAGAFASALPHAQHGRLAAVASRSADRAAEFADKHGADRSHGSYEDLFADDDVDAVYIATPHPWHAELAILAAEAGKHVLCEKPAALNRFDTMAAIEAARRAGIIYMEAFMYRCNPQTVRLAELLKEEPIGTVRMIEASFGFRGGNNPESRLMNNALGGGGILDVGCYPVSLSRLIAGAVDGERFADPTDVQAVGVLGETNVDEYTAAVLKFDNGIVAEVATAIRVNLANTATIYGTDGRIVIPSPWTGGGREGGTGVIEVYRSGEKEEITVECGWLYAHEADTFAAAVADGEVPAPAMSPEDTIGNMTVLDEWREAIGLTYEDERVENLTRPVHGR
ncbi:MAG: Gfo/Idh/MocA family oxidoreductase, partial [Phycisphaeraceae bacterium]|nr:Gfo/Idh/MocA family oxidoreductase [Phycisphaeraceae bacterium]